jgi:hypothetical protein
MADFMQGILGKLQGDEGRARLYGMGLGLSQLGAGQPVNIAPAMQMLEQRQAMNTLSDQMQNGGFMDMFSPQEQAYLATLPPTVAQEFIGQRVFAQPTPVEYEVLSNGLVIDPTTGAAVADHRQTDTPEDPASVREYQFAVQNGYQGSFEDWRATAPRSGTEVTIENRSESAFSAETGKLLAQESAAVAEQGDAANRSLVQINQLDELMQGQGGITSAFTAMAGDLGITFEGTGEVQAARAIISQLVPQQRPPGSGPMSDADLELFKQSLPRLINTPEGNQQIIQTMRRIAEYDVQRGQIARRLQLGQISREEAFAEYAGLANPLAGFSAGGQAPSLPPVPDMAGVTPDNWADIYGRMSPEQQALFQ